MDMSDLISNAEDLGLGFHNDACKSRKSFASNIDLAVMATVQTMMEPNIRTDATEDTVASPLSRSALLIPDDNTIFGCCCC